MCSSCGNLSEWRGILIMVVCVELDNNSHINSYLWCFQFILHILPLACCKERKVKGRQLSGIEPRTPLAWAANALPLSYGNRTITDPHNPLYVLHRWYWIPHSHTWQPLSMCRQKSVRGWLTNTPRWRLKINKITQWKSSIWRLVLQLPRAYQPAETLQLMCPWY